MEGTTLAVSALVRNRRKLLLVVMAFFGFLLTITAIIAAVLAVIFGATAALCGDSSMASGDGSGPGPAPTEYALKDIPPNYLTAYRRAAGRWGLDWRFLAGIGWRESDHGRSTLPGVHSAMNVAGAAGPMQMGISDTCAAAVCASDNWGRKYKADGDGDGKMDVYDIDDAAMASAHFLADHGAPDSWPAAVNSYIGGDPTYVASVFEHARAYGYDGDGIHNAPGVSDVPATGLDAATEAAGQQPTGGDGKGSSDPSQMIWPTEVHTIRSPFGPREAPCLGCSTYHQGLDIGAAEGDPVHAVLNGRVTFRGEMSGYGNYVCLTHSDALTTCYGHLSRFGRWQVNDTVTRGAVIGYVGHTGNVTGPHLHFEVRLGGDLNATAVDPAPYLQGAGDASAGGGEVDTVADAGCGDQTTGGGVADLTSADVVREPRRMEALPKWATAEGYPRPPVADARIIPSLLYLLRHYNVRVHDCLASGHNTHGSGDSCDIVPADDPLPVPGRMTPGWANVTQLARDLGWEPPGPGYAGGYACSSGAPFVPAIYIVCYDGDVNHGDPDHITGSCACPHLHITFENPVHSAPVALATPPEWVKVFPIEQTDDGSAPSVQMVGDSLAVGTQDALPAQLDGYQVATNAKEGRTLAEGMSIVNALASKPSILAVSLFTNDDPRNVDALADAVRQSTQAVQADGCVVWATIHHPAVGGVSYDRANAKLRTIAADNPRVKVVEWDAAADDHPGWFGADGVHPDPDGYQARARLYAQAIRRCAP
jgi:murein DD-endopeptidase MepM/ murein hydrolase activator NlpD